MTGADRGGRVHAPFGRRAVEVIASRREGAYVVLQCSDPEGPRPAAGQFYMLSAADRWGGGAHERPFLPRAFSVLRAPPDGTRLDFMLEDVGPGTGRLCELGPGDRLLITGPLGNGFAPPRDGRRPLLDGSAGHRGDGLRVRRVLRLRRLGGNRPRGADRPDSRPAAAR
jgi:ferredoxin-NADP reductase